MPASICPAAILLAMMIALSSEVPQARAVVIAGVSGERPEDSTASRARFQSAARRITAPNATSPSSTPCRSNLSTSAPSVLTAMPKLPTSAYAVLLRQNGMRTPPSTATRLVMDALCCRIRAVIMRPTRCDARPARRPTFKVPLSMPYVFDTARLSEIAATQAQAFREAQPYPHIVIDGFLPDAVARELAAVFPGPDDDVAWVTSRPPGPDANSGAAARLHFP